MFQLFENKKRKEYTLASPATGTIVPLEKVPDPLFSTKMLGEGIAVQPLEGKIYAPADGKIIQVIDTLHAISMITDFGAELIVHVGLDSVKMNGGPFTPHVKNDDMVKRGDLLLTVDLKAIEDAGFQTVTPVIVCNISDYEKFISINEQSVNAGDTILTLIEKKR